MAGEASHAARAAHEACMSAGRREACRGAGAASNKYLGVVEGRRHAQPAAAAASSSAWDHGSSLQPDKQREGHAQSPLFQQRGGEIEEERRDTTGQGHTRLSQPRQSVTACQAKPRGWG